jgi:hypothetical protein
MSLSFFGFNTKLEDFFPPTFGGRNRTEVLIVPN